METQQLAYAVTFLSAFLFACSFYWPTWCGSFAISFLILLFWFERNYGPHLSWRQGLVWGITFYSLHLVPLWELVAHHGEGQWRFMLVVCIIGYYAVLSIIWFWGAHILSRYTHAIWWRLIVWVCVSWFYFIMVSKYSFIVLGRAEGYCFGIPLIPIAHLHWLLLPLAYIGRFSMLLLIISGAALVSNVSIYQLVLSMSLLLLASVFVKERKGDIPSYIYKIGYVAPSVYRPPLEAAQDILLRINELLADIPNGEYIIMPESTFGCALNEWPEIIDLLCTNCVADDIIIMLGAYRKSVQKRFNSFFCLQNSLIIQNYDKKHLFILTEEKELISYLNPFYKESELIINKGEGEIPYIKTKDFTYISIICSELFYIPYTEHITHYTQGIDFLLFITNESWFTYSYFRNLFLLNAKLYAQELQIPILYVGHTNMYYIDINNTSYQFPNF